MNKEMEQAGGPNRCSFTVNVKNCLSQSSQRTTCPYWFSLVTGHMCRGFKRLMHKPSDDNIIVMVAYIITNSSEITWDCADFLRKKNLCRKLVLFSCYDIYCCYTYRVLMLVPSLNFLLNSHLRHFTISTTPRRCMHFMTCVIWL